MLGIYLLITQLVASQRVLSSIEIERERVSVCVCFNVFSVYLALFPCIMYRVRIVTGYSFPVLFEYWVICAMVCIIHLQVSFS
jgi:hypothetical protein